MGEPSRSDVEGPEPCVAYALWLLPAPASGDRLQPCIEELARRHGTPAFAPHITLCSGEGSADGADRRVAAEALARRWSPLEFPVEGLAWGADFFTFFFLRLRQPPGVDRIAEALAALPGCQGPPVGPHLSLLYADPTPGSPGATIDRPQLAQELTPQLSSPIGVDRLALVRPGAGGWRHGWPWRLEATFPLGWLGDSGGRQGALPEPSSSRSEAIDDARIARSRQLTEDLEQLLQSDEVDLGQELDRAWDVSALHAPEAS